jgi:hypothetical protein
VSHCPWAIATGNSIATNSSLRTEHKTLPALSIVFYTIIITAKKRK